MPKLQENRRKCQNFKICKPRNFLIFRPIWAYFVALILEIQDNCDALKEKIPKSLQDVFLDTPKIARGQNMIFVITSPNLVRFGWVQFYLLQHENPLLFHINKGTLNLKLRFFDFSWLSRENFAFRAITRESFVRIVQTKFILKEVNQPVILSTHKLQKDLWIKKLIFRLR